MSSSSSSPDTQHSPGDPINAPIISTEELPHQTSIEHPAEGTIFIVRDDETDFHVRVSENNIELINKKGKTCIDIKIEDDEVYLSGYYWTATMKECPVIPHRKFFDFLRKLGQLYGKPVTLLDASDKTLKYTKCRINSVVFALAGNPTFYERFGFRNEQFTNIIAWLRKKTLEELLGMRKRRSSVRLDATRPVLLRMLSMGGMDLSTTIEDLAKFLVRKCKHSHSHNTEFRRRSKVSASRTRRFKDYSGSDELEYLLKWLHSLTGELHVKKFVME